MGGPSQPESSQGPSQPESSQDPRQAAPHGRGGRQPGGSSGTRAGTRRLQHLLFGDNY